ncbi:hypothetical protein Q7P37_004796 [Cladosporium fusiforme]
MSGLEVIGIVASVVSAFHGAAELVKLYRERRATKREKREQEQHDREVQDHMMHEMLHMSLEQGELAVRGQFLDQQRALGRHGQLLRLGDARARQELLMIAVSMQAQVIDSLGRAQESLDVIVEMAQLQMLHEMAITKKVEAVRSIGELRQRIEVSLPISRLSADIALGLSRRSSNESMAKTFVTAAANVYLPEPMVEGLLAPHRGLDRQCGLSRQHGPSLTTLSSYQYLIPAIRAQDIEILTLAGEPIEHDEQNAIMDITNMNIDSKEPPLLQLPFSNSSSSSVHTPDSDLFAHPWEVAGPYYPPRSHSEALPSPWPYPDSPLSPQTHARNPTTWISRATSAPSAPLAPDLSLPTPHPYCAGALAAQNSFSSSITLQNLPTLPGSSKLSPSYKCHHCDFNMSTDSTNTLLSRISFSTSGIRYRFPFLARSHAPYTHPPASIRPRYAYGCQFCTAEGRRSGVHDGAEALMAHVAAKHCTNLTPEVRARTRCVVGRLAGKGEGWDVNLENVGGGKMVGRWIVRAVTALPT